MSQTRRVSTSPDNRIECEKCGREVISVGYESGMCPSCEIKLREEKVKKYADSFNVSAEEIKKRAKKFDLKIVEINTYESLINNE